MSVPSVGIAEFDQIDALIKEGKRDEAMNWIVSHEAIEQIVLLEYIKRVHPEN